MMKQEVKKKSKKTLSETEDDNLFPQPLPSNNKSKTSTASAITNEDRQLLLTEWNRTHVKFDEIHLCLHELIALQTQRTPNRVAVVFEQQSLTYLELDQQSNLLAKYLKSLGVGRDVLVGLLVERSSEMLVSLLGILKAGGAYVPLDPIFPPDRLGYMIEDSKMPILITHRGLDKTLKVRPSQIIHLDHKWEEIEIPKKNLDTATALSANSESLAYVLYTSGSTGKPKGVAIPHSAIVNFLLSMKREPGITAADIMLAITTPTFDIASLELYLPLISGAKVVIASHEDAVDPRRLVHLLHDCTFLQSTPATWRALLYAGWKGSPNIKALCGGEAFPPDLAPALLSRCASLWNMYGPTETTVWSTIYRVTAADSQQPIGRPIANTQVYILDEHHNLIPPGEVGELYIGGQGLARGYLNRPELTRERFVPNPFLPNEFLYRTGDLARWRRDGLLECLGRIDHQVKIRGYRIELGEIESCILKHPAIRQVVVITREDKPGDKRLAAYFVAENAPPDFIELIRANLSAILPDYMIPSHFIRLDVLPLTLNGKIDRKALPAPISVLASSFTSSYVSPRTNLEIRLAAAWKEVLGIAQVGVNDNFFDLGGDSVNVIQLLVAIQNTTGLELSLGTIFKFPTIRTLTESLSSEAEIDTSMVVPLQSEGVGPPIFCLCGINLYQEFAHSLGKTQPVFGIYVPEEHVLHRKALQGEKHDINVQELAYAYYKAIVKVSPQGPYRLAGVSFGGIVAIEVASIMRKKGFEVELVILFDTLLPCGFRRNWIKWGRNQICDIFSKAIWKKLSYKIAKIYRRFISHKWTSKNRYSKRSVEDAQIFKMEAYEMAIEKWKPSDLQTDFDVVLFRAQDAYKKMPIDLAEDYGWSRYLKGPLSIRDVKGKHLGILKKPDVIELGRKLQDFLD